MGEHLSWLVVDEIVAGLSPAPAHAQTCAACQDRLNLARKDRAAALEDPAFARRFQRLVPQVKPRRQFWTFALAPALAAAAVVVLVLWAPRRAPSEDGGDRIKGAAFLEVRRVETGQSVTRARVGEQVALALGGAGHRYALVIAVDERGQVSQLWPRAGAPGELPAGAAREVPTAFEVTPGSLALIAFYADSPLSAESARSAVTAAVAEARRAGRSPLEVQPAPVPGEKGRARLTFGAEPSR